MKFAFRDLCGVAFAGAGTDMKVRPHSRSVNSKVKVCERAHYVHSRSLRAALIAVVTTLPPRSGSGRNGAALGRCVVLKPVPNNP